MYLEPWEDSDRQVWTYRLLVAHEKVPLWKLRSKKAVAWHSHLYTQIVTGRETDEIERWFDREFESPAKEPLTKALSDAQLTRKRFTENVTNGRHGTSNRCLQSRRWMKQEIASVGCHK